jgi:hypothetical protein
VGEASRPFCRRAAGLPPTPDRRLSEPGLTGRPNETVREGGTEAGGPPDAPETGVEEKSKGSCSICENAGEGCHMRGEA